MTLMDAHPLCRYPGFLPALLLTCLCWSGQQMTAVDASSDLSWNDTMSATNSASDPGPSKSTATGFVGRPFIIQRVFNAPRDLVWKAWTEHERLMKWFAPAGDTYIKGTFDFRPGGVSHYCMRDADGNVGWGRWVFCDIIPPERLVYIDAFSDEQGTPLRNPNSPDWPLEMLTTVTLSEADGKTTLNLVWTPFNAKDDERKVFDGAFRGMQMGWKGTLDQLAAYLAQPGGGTATPSAP